MITVSRDYEGLQQAAYELMRVAIEGDRSEKIRGDEANVERMIEDAAPALTLSDGFYDRARYLLDLEEEMEVVKIEERELLQSDVKGVAAVKRARAQFLQDHPGCGRCGQRNYKHKPKCSGCGEKL
jgi:hypothetical protein